MKKFKRKTLKFKNIGKDILALIKYILLITVYGFYLLIQKIGKKLKFLNFLEKFLYKLIHTLEIKKDGQMSNIDLIDLAIKNITSKKNRFVVTVGGMTIGIAGIVFLVSIGYGLQTLVTNRVARLEEMRQADVSVLPGSNLDLNDNTLDSFREIENVQLAIPQIAVVGKINFNNSITDMAVYGVTREYLEQSAIAPVSGKMFNNNELETDVVVTKENIKESYIDQIQLSEGELTGEFVIVEGESEIGEGLVISKVQFPESMKDREAVVNRTFLRVLGIEEEDALGKIFSVTFVSTNRSLENDQQRIESNAVDYEIIGITPDDATPLFYVPFIHLKVLGITNYSQVKIAVNQEKDLANVRQEIEAKGFNTSSVVDTVAQIEGLFSTVRTILGLLGTVALLVAALGMFNTLTVSLLERTREIGLLKAMGMKPDEIRDLFLAESMIMGSLGGFLGLVIGLALGKMLELLLSAYSVLNGAGSITIIDTPLLFTLSILLISFLVGLATGIYPARRAKKISALNALRYE